MRAIFVHGFANAMHQLDAGDRNGRIPKAFEAEHRIDTSFEE
jgi:hypothetical protein